MKYEVGQKIFHIASRNSAVIVGFTEEPYLDHQVYLVKTDFGGEIVEALECEIDLDPYKIGDPRASEVRPEFANFIPEGDVSMLVTLK